MGNACSQQQFCASHSNIRSFLTYNFQPIQMPFHKNASVVRTLQSFQKKLDYQKIKEVTLRAPMIEKDKLFIYVGEWLDNSPHGYGKIFFQSGQYFEGELRKGVAQGNGRYIFANGDYYQGKISNNSAYGQGKFVSNNVTFYGQWKNSKPFSGTFIFFNGLKIQLENENRGKIIWSDNKIYKGTIKDLNPDGYGQLTFENGNFYKGQWKEGVMHGQGQFKWADGSSYKGGYLQGVKEGKGKFIYKNQKKYYEGQWKAGKMHGIGKIFFQQRLIQTGIFQNGILLKKYEQQQIKIKQKINTKDISK